MQQPSRAQTLAQANALARLRSRNSMGGVDSNNQGGNVGSVVVSVRLLYSETLCLSAEFATVCEHGAVFTSPRACECVLSQCSLGHHNLRKSFMMSEQLS